ncbi:putative glycolipid-binding domain-containing protein [Leptolyngbya sp. FACHB-671]|uniref:putative glycolipid-binding domain-containing protein n=1 Tax=Leptolyngbya sp. FACHB-671 TaxID=2692812 RepID=UPI0016873F58|nr:putative glycolipid-binding domain-containing protein [Leptolyngbya sp. FACHB-671]MBD2070535.1 putative glycolipid-binding domain-containing protein [Leptolyngbya sp. FACHB-671]
MSSLDHTILWQRLDLPGHDICRLWKSTAGWQLSGTAIFLFEQMPCLLAYEVSVNNSWQTCAASVSGFVGQSDVALAIAPTSNGHWSINGIEFQEAAGCMDLDLGFTPATNLIAIRRMALRVEEQSQAPAAWLDFLDFKLKQLEQYYRRVSSYEYEYAAPDVDYAATLEVDRFVARLQVKATEPSVPDDFI